MRFLDFSSWQGILTTLASLLVITLMGVGIRLVLMQTVQARQQAANRQINERLKTLIAAYKTLGGSFTGDLSVDPRHLRQLRQQAAAQAGLTVPAASLTDGPVPGLLLPGDEGDLIGGELGERMRRTRDAVEAALSDIILLGTEQQVQLAAEAAAQMVAGQPIQTAALVVSLRDVIRDTLGLAPIPTGLLIPAQGPARPAMAGAGKGGKAEAGGNGSRGPGGAGGGGAGAAGMGMGAGMGAGYGAGSGVRSEDTP